MTAIRANLAGCSPEDDRTIRSAAITWPRLRQRDLYAGPARSAASFSLAAELPAALLAQLLGIHISVAVGWQRASNRDWSSYAAAYSRRPARSPSGTPKRSS